MSKKPYSYPDGGRLPGHLTADILLRIPARSLCRLKLVCKTWKIEIDDPGFTEKHVIMQESTTEKIVFTGDSSISLLIVDKPPRVLLNFDDRHHFQFPVDDFYERFLMIGSINGIVGLYYCGVSYKFIILWNPALNKFKLIQSQHHNSLVTSVGLAFNDEDKDLKLVKFFLPIHDDDDDDKYDDNSVLEIYSSNDNLWRRSRVVPFRPNRRNCRFIIEGVPYWDGLDNVDSEVLAAFNVATGILKKFPYPEISEGCKFYPVKMKGRASGLVYLDDDKRVEIFTLDERRECWIKDASISLNVPFETINMLQPFKGCAQMIACGFQNHERLTSLIDVRSNVVLPNVALDALRPRWKDSYHHVESLVCIRGMRPLLKLRENFHAASSYQEHQPPDATSHNRENSDEFGQPYSNPRSLGDSHNPRSCTRVASNLKFEASVNCQQHQTVVAADGTQCRPVAGQSERVVSQKVVSRQIPVRSTCYSDEFGQPYSNPRSLGDSHNPRSRTKVVSDLKFEASVNCQQHQTVVAADRTQCHPVAGQSERVVSQKAASRQIPLFIEELSCAIPENCVGENAGVYVGGREVHQKDLLSRELPTERDRSYRVLNEDSDEELDSLGKLSPKMKLELQE